MPSADACKKSRILETRHTMLPVCHHHRRQQPYPFTRHPRIQMYILDENEARRASCCHSVLPEGKGDEDVRPFITALGRYLPEL